MTAYLTSGTLERYVVGLTTPEENRELEEMAAQHTEIKAELAAIRKALHGYVLAHQVEPPDDLREKILSAPQKQPVTSPNRAKPEAQPSSREAIASRSDKPVGKVNYATILAALLGLALVAACATALIFYSDAKGAKADLAAAKSEVAVLQKEKTALAGQTESLKNDLAFLRDRDQRPLPMLGTRLAPNADALIYWNGVKRSCFLDVRRLPTVPEGQQLQLWATTGGTTRNLGTPAVSETQELAKLTFVDDPEVFFVTLEAAGDAPERPDRSKVVMIGKGL